MTAGVTHCRSLLSWFCYPNPPDPGGRIDFVVDDQGDLVPCTDHVGRDYFVHRGYIEASAQAWLEERDRRREEEARAQPRRESVPPRVTAEIGESEQDYAGRACTDIVISHDEAWARAPHFTLRVSGFDPVTLTQAQLSALLAAAEALCRPVRRARRFSSARGLVA